MKKLMFVSLIVLVLALSGCNNVVTPQPTVVEPTPTEEPTQIPTPIEEPTEVPTPTLEPTATPIEEPTQEPLPDICPAEGFEIPNPEDLTIDLGEYGTITFYDTLEGRSNILVVGTNANFVKRGERALDSLQNEGGGFSFKLPSSAFVSVQEGVKIDADIEYWPLIDSQGAGFIIPTGANIEVTLEPGKEFEEDFLFIYFISGEPIELADIAVSGKTPFVCREMWWEFTLENPDFEELELRVVTKHRLVLQDYEGDIMGLNSQNRGELQALSGLGFEDDTITVKLAQGSKMKFAVLSLFGRSN